MKHENKKYCSDKINCCVQFDQWENCKSSTFDYKIDKLISGLPKHKHLTQTQDNKCERKKVSNHIYYSIIYYSTKSIILPKQIIKTSLNYYSNIRIHP